MRCLFLKTICLNKEYLECAGFVLFQCKNKIPRATEIQDVLIAKSVSVTAIHHA